MSAAELNSQRLAEVRRARSVWAWRTCAYLLTAATIIALIGTIR